MCILMAYRVLGREDFITIKLVAADLAELETKDGLLNAIISTLPLEIYGMHIIETLVVNLLSMIKKEYKLLTLARKSMS